MKPPQPRGLCLWICVLAALTTSALSSLKSSTATADDPSKTPDKADPDVDRIVRSMRKQLEEAAPQHYDAYVGAILEAMKRVDVKVAKENVRKILLAEVRSTYLSPEKKAAWMGFSASLDELTWDVTSACHARRFALDIERRTHGKEQHWHIANGELALKHAERLRDLGREERLELAAMLKGYDDADRLYARKQYAEALKAAKAPLATHRQLFGPDDFPLLVAESHFLNDCYLRLEDWPNLERWTRDALQRTETVLGPDHPYRAKLMALVAYSLVVRNDAFYEVAKPLVKNAEMLLFHGAERTETLPDAVLTAFPSFADHLGADVATSLAPTLAAMPDSVRAQDLVLLVGICQLGHDPEGAAVLGAHAETLRARAGGDTAEHERLFKALLTAASSGRTDRLRPVYDRALPTLKATPPQLQGQLLGTLGMQFWTAVDADNLPAAEQAQVLYGLLIDLWKQKGGYFTALLGQQAALDFLKKDYKKLLATQRQLVSHSAEENGESSLMHGETLLQLAGAHDILGEYAEAESVGEKAVGITLQVLGLLMAGQSELEQLGTAQQARRAIDVYLSVAGQAKVSAATRYRPVLAWKGAVFRRQRLARLARADPRWSKVYAELESTARALAAVYQRWRALPRDGSDARTALKAETFRLTERLESLERELSAGVLGPGAGTPTETPSPESLRVSLPPGAALVDYWEYDDEDPNPDRPVTARKGSRLVAFIVRRDRPVEAVELGPARPVLELVRQWLGASGAVPEPGAADDEEERRLAGRLRATVWTPLERSSLDGVRTVAIAADGPLVRLPFVALPGRNHPYLVQDDLTVIMAPFPQTLIRPTGPKARGAVAAGSQARSLLTIADVNFGPGERFPPLKALKGLCVPVEAMYRAAFPGATVRPLRDAQASEYRVRALAPGATDLLFVTHAYSDAKDRIDDGLGGKSRPGTVFGLWVAEGPSRHSSAVQALPPGLLVGMALAGANRVDRRGPDGKDNGRLTATEIVTLDLSRTRLAVVMACQSSLGTELPGEGLYGLQRAFSLAGAGATVTSLWAVDPVPSRALILKFYEFLLDKHLPPRDALRAAQRWAITDGDGIGGDPRYWAAWVYSGEL